MTDTWGYIPKPGQEKLLAIIRAALQRSIAPCGPAPVLVSQEGYKMTRWEYQELLREEVPSPMIVSPIRRGRIGDQLNRPFVFADDYDDDEDGSVSDARPIPPHEDGTGAHPIDTTPAHLSTTIPTAESETTESASDTAASNVRPTQSEARAGPGMPSSTLNYRPEFSTPPLPYGSSIDRQRQPNHYELQRAAAKEQPPGLFQAAINRFGQSGSLLARSLV